MPKVFLLLYSVDKYAQCHQIQMFRNGFAFLNVPFNNSNFGQATESRDRQTD